MKVSLNVLLAVDRSSILWSNSSSLEVIDQGTLSAGSLASRSFACAEATTIKETAAEVHSHAMLLVLNIRIRLAHILQLHLCDDNIMPP